MNKVTLPVQFIKPVFRADRSVRLEFDTRELTGIEAAVLLDYRQYEGWLLFSPNNDLSLADIPDEKPNPMLGTKTQAQRLRGAIWRLWEQKGKQGDFDAYYKTITESMIDQIKERLE